MLFRAKLLRTLFASSLLIMAAAGCKKDDVNAKIKNGPDPDTNSGVDAKRGGAKPMQINRPETDSVSWPKLQRTKWKSIEIATPGKDNVLDCELRIDNTGADLNIDLFNSLGTQIGFTPGPAPNKLKKLAVKLEELGTYFVRMQAAMPKDESDFSVICRWEEEAVVPDAPDKPKKAVKRTPTEKPAKAETFEEKIEKGTEGRIKTSFREGGQMVMIVDKGAAAGVHEGTEGTVLEGKSGRQPLDGGTFKILQVIDDSTSKAQSSVRSIGKNSRVVLFLK
ncbi:MAG TPA: hypothetical protein PKO07_02845 [Pseudomonadota bacterium]|nr:hypothetical protein [Pseudomonadota bacterium]